MGALRPVAPRSRPTRTSISCASSTSVPLPPSFPKCWRYCGATLQHPGSQRLRLDEATINLSLRIRVLLHKSPRLLMTATRPASWQTCRAAATAFSDDPATASKFFAACSSSRLRARVLGITPAPAAGSLRRTLRRFLPMPNWRRMFEKETFADASLNRTFGFSLQDPHVNDRIRTECRLLRQDIAFTAAARTKLSAGFFLAKMLIPDVMGVSKPQKEHPFKESTDSSPETKRKQ